MTAYLVISGLLAEAEPERKKSLSNTNKKHHPAKKTFYAFLHFEVVINSQCNLIDVVFGVV